jgi:hypothetical protein
VQIVALARHVNIAPVLCVRGSCVDARHLGPSMDDADQAAMGVRSRPLQRAGQLRVSEHAGRSR